MNPSNVFQLEMLSMLNTKRRLLLRTGMTLFLGLPFVLIELPMRVRAAGVLFLVLITGFFGAAVAMTRRKSDGRWKEFELLPVRLTEILGDFTLAGAVMDLIQLAPILVLLFVYHGTLQGMNMLETAAFLCGTLVALNALGILLGWMLQTNAEVHLAGALGVGCIAVGSGLVPLPVEIAGIVASMETWNPVSGLVRSLEACLGGSVDSGSGWGAALVPALFAAWVLSRALNRPHLR